MIPCLLRKTIFAWRLRTDSVINDLEVSSFPNTVSIKMALISISFPFLAAKPAGKA